MIDGPLQIVHQVNASGVHACSKRGRRLESKGYGDSIKIKETRWDGV